MKQLKDYALTIYMLMSVLAIAEGSVTVTMIGDFADKGSMLCDSKVVLMCKIQPYSISMTWEIDETAAANCTNEECRTYTTGLGNYRFSFDTSNGIFNITLDPVTFADNGKTFKCDDESDFAYISAVVKVLPENSATTISSSKGTFFTAIKATSGCLYPSSSVTFEWYYFKEGHDPVIYKESNRTTSIDKKGCTSGSCGGKGVVKVTSTLNIKEDPHGEEYYFQVLVKQPDKADGIVRTNNYFKLKEESTATVAIRSVGSLRDTGSVQCGSNVRFICSIPTYKYTMKWTIDSEKVAECVTTNCVQYPPYKIDNIEFSPDTSNGEFNMTINPVTLKAGGRKIKCRYGSEGVELNLEVKVLPTQDTTEIVESKDDSRNMINLTAMTGCVFPSSAITMQWYYYEEDETPTLYKMSSPYFASNFSVCNSGACCGNSVVKCQVHSLYRTNRMAKSIFFKL